MDVITILIVFPFAAALVLAFMKKPGKIRSGFVFASCSVIIAAVLYFSINGFINDISLSYLMETHM